MKMRLGTDRAWKVQILDSAKEPIVYSPDDVLRGIVWVGGSSKTELFAPTVTWIDATAGIILISISADQVTPDPMAEVPDLVEPGKYQLLVLVTTFETEKTQEVWSEELELLPIPGQESPLRSYVRFRDLLAISQAIVDAQDKSDETGFAYQCYEASNWLDGIILARSGGAQYWSHGFASNSSTTIQGYLADGKLMITPKVREIVARRAVAMILESAGSEPKLVAQAQRQYSIANNLISTYQAEFDVNNDGVADVVVPCNYLSSRYPTPVGY